MNRRGQALIEFIIIAPILIFILLAIVDFGMIFSKSNRLEGLASDVIEMYKNSEPFDKINLFVKNESENIDVLVENEDNKYIRINLKEKFNVMTPGLNLILGNPYLIEVNRVIYYE